MLLSIIAILALLTALGISFASGAFASLSWLWVLPVSFIAADIVYTALCALAAFYICGRVDLETPQEHDDPKFRKMAKLLIDAILSILMLRIDVQGKEKLPKEGRFLLVCNHLSLLDPLVMLSRLWEYQLSFVSKKENMEMPLIGPIMHKSMCQMVDRENDREALKAIIRCIKMLKDDEVNLVVFPEGYTSRDGHLQHFRHGVFKIALKAQVPIVVCTLEGTEKALNYGSITPKHIHFGKKVTFHILCVLPPESFQGKTTVQLGQELFDIMAADLGPEYVPLEKNPEEG